MKHRLIYIPIVFLFLLSFTDCAKKGMPTGGPKDTIPPVVLKSSPENYSTRFNRKEIEVRFDEYIKLNNLNQELIISPPMKNTPLITPLSAAKTLTITLEDTLMPNTTYVFNFGNSIQDNNEGNVLKQFKYVFSTGDYVDSLKLSGAIRDAEKIKPEESVAVMLYERGESFSDSIIYKEKPKYVAVTQDTTGTFEFTNLKEGEYLLIALKEKNRSYTYNPKEDKIGFVSEVVRIPSDTNYVLTMFKEQPKYRAHRAGIIGKNHLVFGYEGAIETIDIQPLSEVPSDFEYISYKDQSKDSIHYWYKPSFDADSLLFTVQHRKQLDTVQVRMRELYWDSLSVKPITTGNIKLKDTFKLRTTVPIVAVDSTKIELMNTDSIAIATEIRIQTPPTQVGLWFKKEELQTYRGLLLPGAMTDFYGNTNDSIVFGIKTKAASDYGTLTLTLQNVERFPVIVQLVDDKYNVEAEAYLEDLQQVYFDEIQPKEYYLRLIYDENENGKWDSGNFLEKRKAERIIYYPSKLDIRSNWSLNETFILRN